MRRSFASYLPLTLASGSSVTVMNINGSIALVTGANRGLGRAFAHHLLERGARKVYAGAREPSSIIDSGLVPLRLDITDPDQIQRVLDDAGDVTLLINNAGTNSWQNLVTGDLDQIK